MDEEQCALAGEVYLCAWSDSVESSAGTTDAWIKVYLSDGSMLDNIRPAETRGKAKTGGKRFQLVMVEIGDDEQPIKEDPKIDHTLSNMAQYFGDRETDLFKTWVSREKSMWLTSCRDNYKENGGVWDALLDPEKCRQIILFACSIDSRAKLDTDSLAADAFLEIRGAYTDWKRRNAKPHQERESQA